MSIGINEYENQYFIMTVFIAEINLRQSSLCTWGHKDWFGLITEAPTPAVNLQCISWSSSVRATPMRGKPADLSVVPKKHTLQLSRTIVGHP